MVQRSAWQRWSAEWAILAARYSGGLAWARSLLLKSAILGMGAVFVYWAGWPEPSLPVHPMASFPQTPGAVSHIMSGSSSGHTTNLLQDGILRRKGSGGASHTLASDKGDQPKERTSFLVDLNDGTSEELEHLPGIGAILAGRIIAHRASHGAFRRVEDLVLVPGIGNKRLQQLRSLVGVRASDKGIASP